MIGNPPANSLVKAIVFLVLHLTFGAIILGLLLVFVPNCERILMDFGTPLPYSAVVMLRLSHFAAKYWLILFPAVLLCDCGAMYGLYKSRRYGSAKAWGYLVLLAEMLFIGCGFLAVIAPLTKLITNLSEMRG
jgi:type II secretory pathway component PulF